MLWFALKFHNTKNSFMKEKILALLLAAFAGVRKDGLNQLARTLTLQATTEDEAKTLVEKLTKEQVDSFVKEYRADVDKEVSDSNKTFETNLKKKFDLIEKTNESGDGGSGKSGNGGGDDIATKLDALLDAKLKPLQEKLSKYEQDGVAKTRLQSLNDKLATCKDENFKAQALKDFSRMQFDSDEAFNEYLTEKETAITTANQNVANAALGGQGKPLFTQKDETGISKGVADFVESQKPDSKTVLTGKEV
jgi:hypothetical protein